VHSVFGTFNCTVAISPPPSPTFGPPPSPGLHLWERKLEYNGRIETEAGLTGLAGVPLRRRRAARGRDGVLVRAELYHAAGWAVETLLAALCTSIPRSDVCPRLAEKVVETRKCHPGVGEQPSAVCKKHFDVILACAQTRCSLSCFEDVGISPESHSSKALNGGAG